MKIAIMQPYFFPYIGYWQLISEVDKFVIYDDVNYIKQGWINRNRLLINEAPGFLILPVNRSSSNSLICALEVDEMSGWQKKTEKKILYAYAKSKYFDEVFPIIKEILDYDDPNLANYLRYQIKSICHRMKIDTKIIGSSALYKNNDLTGSARIKDICRKESATVYINAAGGRDLYNRQEFAAANIELKFIEVNPIHYAQRAKSFFPYLSIIDVLMSVGFAGISEHLQSYKTSDY